MNEQGLCGCGCGGKTKVSPDTVYRYGYVKGQPRRFIRGHNRRVAPRRLLAKRFWDLVERQADCWLWRGGKTWGGYGSVTDDERNTRIAHRVAYELLVQPIPEGLTIDHLCRNRLCVNPAHLEPVTIKENILRGVSPSALNARKTHCIRGHLFDDENTYITSKGQRYCKLCALERQRQRRARLKEASAA